LPSVSGGIAEYTVCQAQALEKAGAKVISLVPPSFLNGRQVGIKTIACLCKPPSTGGLRFFKKIKMAWRNIASRLVLFFQIVKQRPDLVLLDSYSEYLAPIWVWPHWLLAKVSKIKYAAVLHDPVRNYVVGPLWWHRLSVRMAYWPLDFVLVHEKLGEPSPVPARVRVVQVPHGLYKISGVASDPLAVRRAWGVSEGQKVFLSFGYVRDGKNLDLAIRALTFVPEAFLLVAGSVASTSDKPFAYYRELAAQLGMVDRCRFFEGFVADQDLGRYFAGADFVLLTYASSFHSQSGVLNIAAYARKPVLASAAPSPLIESVKNFELGVTVVPDSQEAVVAGMRRLLASPPQARWDDYEAAASWSVNAQGVLRAAGLTGES